MILGQLRDIQTNVSKLGPSTKWVVGVDLGQSIDPTAIAVVEVATRASARALWYSMPEEHLPPDAIRPEDYWFDSAGTGGLMDPNRVLRMDVRHLERLPLHMSYVDQIAHVKALMRRPPLDVLPDVGCRSDRRGPPGGRYVPPCARVPESNGSHDHGREHRVTRSRGRSSRLQTSVSVLVASRPSRRRAANRQGTAGISHTCQRIAGLSRGFHRFGQRPLWSPGGSA